MKTKKEHENFLKIAQWDDVTEVLLNLEQHRHDYKDTMSPEDLKGLDDIIDLYDSHRARLLNELSKNSSFNRTMGLEIKESIEEMIASTDLLEEDDF